MSETQGIVLDSGKGWAIILLANGEYRRVRTSHLLMPGEIYQGKKHSNYAKYTVAAAIFLILLIGIVDFFNVLAYAEVSSGVEIGVNRWNRVVSLSAVNSEGEMLLDETNIKGQKLEKALEVVVQKSLAENQLTASSPLTILIKKPDDKPLPPGIAKKLDDVIAQEVLTAYELHQLKFDNKDQSVYGFTVTEKTGKRQRSNQAGDDNRKGIIKDNADKKKYENYNVDHENIRQNSQTKGDISRDIFPPTSNTDKKDSRANTLDEEKYGNCRDIRNIKDESDYERKLIFEDRNMLKSEVKDGSRFKDQGHERRSK